MAKIDVKCPVCGGTNVIKHGISESDKQRYYCKDATCTGKNFQLEYCYTGCRQTPILSARKTRKRLNVKISLYEPTLKGCVVKLFAFQNPLRCMIL